MNEEYINRFIAMQAMQIPRLFSKHYCEQAELRPESALLDFKLPQNMDIEELMDELEDQPNMILLYHHIPTDSTQYGTNCCAYSNPQFPFMFKINAFTDSNLQCNTIQVTLYDSLELLWDEIRMELLRKKSRGHMKYCLADSRITRSFM